MEELTLRQLFDLMLRQMGPQGFWPAETKEEIILGAILVQNTNWRNVEKSLHTLRVKTSFKPEIITDLDIEEIQSLILASGFYKNKSKAIHDFFCWSKGYQFDYFRIKEEYGPDLRSKLLTLHGIGEETADVLLLYVFDEIVFVADNYARRLFNKFSNQNFKNYQQLKKKVDLKAQFNLIEAQEFHGLIDVFGKENLRNDLLHEASFLKEIKLKL